MDFLDKMLAEAEAEVKRAKAKPKGSPVLRPAEDRENLYRPFRLVALYHKTTCASCGAVTDDFEGIFEERKHIRVSDTHMVRQYALPLAGPLPRVKKFLPRDIPYCPQCADTESYQEE